MPNCSSASMWLKGGCFWIFFHAFFSKKSSMSHIWAELSVYVGVWVPFSNPTLTHCCYLTFFWKHTHMWVICFPEIMSYYLFIWKEQDISRLRWNTHRKDTTLIVGVLCSDHLKIGERWQQEGVLWKEIWGSDRERDRGMGRERMGVGRCVRVCVKGGSASYWFVHMVGEGHPDTPAVWGERGETKGEMAGVGGDVLAYVSSLIFRDN